MTSDPNRKPIEVSMLQLFRKKVLTGTKDLETGLSENQSDQTPEKLETLVKAANSIRSSAKMVGLDVAVNLALAMSNILSEMQQGKLPFSGNQLDSLKRGNEIFSEISGIEPSEITDWLSDKENAVREICRLLTQSGQATTPVPEPAAAPKITEKPTAVKPSVTSQKLGGNRKALEGTKRPTAGDEPRVPPFIEKVQPSAEKPAQPRQAPPLDLPMLELFHIEVETHSQTLESGLVEVENDQTPGKVEPLMRAAHSIKGAARMVSLDLAVSLAHSMEDLLSATQHGKMTLSSDNIDLLLKGNDIFSNLAKVSPEEIWNWLQTQEDQIKQIEASLQAVMEGKPAPVAKPPQPPTKQPPKSDKAEKEFIRIQAEKLTRLIGLTGECLVHAKSAKSLSDSLLVIKNELRQLGATLGQAHDFIRTELSLEKTLLAVAESQAIHNTTYDLVNKHIERVELLFSQLQAISSHLYHEVISIRMRPFGEGVQGFSRMVRDLSKTLNKKVNFQVLGTSTLVDSDILERLEAPLMHMIRNAVDHGLDDPEERTKLGKPVTGKVTVEAHHRSGMLEVSVTDDGKGIDLEYFRSVIINRGIVTPEFGAQLNHDEIKEFLFLPGFSTAKKVTEVSGRGVGLDIVLTMIQETGGSKSIETTIGKGTTFRFQLPLTLSVRQVLMVEISGEPYAFPLFRIERLLEVAPADIKIVEDRQYVSFNDEQIGLISAQQLFQLPPPPPKRSKIPLIVISDGSRKYGIGVDKFLVEQEIVVKPIDSRLGKVSKISSAGILENGDPVLIVDVGDLLVSIEKLLGTTRLAKVFEHQEKSGKIGKKILVVDDSLTVREVERRLLESLGYDVTLAIDGLDGWNTVRSGEKFSLVVSDIDMPRMNGFELVACIKNDSTYKSLPVIIVSYKDREEDRQKGLKAGANYYLTKSSFQDETFINAVHELIGEP